MSFLPIMQPAGERTRRRQELCFVASRADVQERIAFVGSAIAEMGFRGVGPDDLDDIRRGYFKGANLGGLGDQPEPGKAFDALFGSWADFLTRGFGNSEERKLAADCFDILTGVRDFVVRPQRRR